jgi:hypothetical protein
VQPAVPPSVVTCSTSTSVSRSPCRTLFDDSMVVASA